jgi:GNAT superfamily N-acetyltransferase
MPEPTIRPATLDEFDRIADVRGTMAAEMGRTWDEHHQGWRPRFAAYWRAKQDAGDTQCFVIDVDGAIAGMALASVTDDYRRTTFGLPRGFINGVYVPPGLRRRGIGRRLMHAALGWLRARGCESVRLHSSVEGRPLYASLGFKEGDEMVLQL